MIRGIIFPPNGSSYKAKTFAAACKALSRKHIRTKPYTPKTNGKAERFIQTALREWAYARAYATSEQRKTHLPEWTHMYNWHRPHGSLNSKPPISRPGQPMDNLLTGLSHLADHGLCEVVGPSCTFAFSGDGEV